MTYGLVESASVDTFIIGIGLKILGVLGESLAQNHSGVFLAIKLEKYLQKVKTNLTEIRSLLINQGCTETEINALQSLPGDVYQTELNVYQIARVLNIGVPISCGIALLVNGDIFASIAVIGIGLLSIPIGELFFKESTFRKDSEIRLGIAAEFYTYIEKIYKEHIWLTTRVNLLSQVPLLLFALKFVFTASGHLLSTFFAFTQGLSGLTGALAYQKARISAIRTAETTTHLIHALSSSSLIATPLRWQEHCSKANREQLSHKFDAHHRTLIKNFSPFMPKGESEIYNLSLDLPGGEICFLRAPSGKGKSTLLSALFHLIEHEGELVFLKNGNVINVHDLSREELNEKIFFFREENVKTNERIVDLFKQVTVFDNQAMLENAKQHFNPLLIDLAWKTSDNLLEQEIKNLDENRQSVFPSSLKDFLKLLRQKQVEQTQRLLTSAGGNLATQRIYPERNFFTLSSGERRRLPILLALETCRQSDKAQLVIFDEPFAHLDEDNILHQLKIIEKLQQTETKPSILTISHYFDERIKANLKHVQEVFLY